MSGQNHMKGRDLDIQPWIFWTARMNHSESEDSAADLFLILLHTRDWLMGILRYPTNINGNTIKSYSFNFLDYLNQYAVFM